MALTGQTLAININLLEVVMNHNHYRYCFPILGSALLLLTILLSSSTGFCQQQTTPEEAIKQLIPITINEENRNVDSDQIVDILKQNGQNSIPAIAAGVEQIADIQQMLNMRLVILVSALGGIGSDESTSLLVQVLGIKNVSPEVVSQALLMLENRTVRRELTAQERAVIASRVDSVNVNSAGKASRIFARCLKVPVAERIIPIVNRLEKELNSPGTVEPIHGAYLSPRVLVRHRFLLAIADIGGESIPSIQLKHKAAVVGTEQEKWWIMSLGMACDKSVIDRLKEMIKTEQDRYVRAEAIRAYARAAKQEAIPLLETLLTDTTESEYDTLPGGRKVLLIQIVARDELTLLKDQMK